MSQALPAISIIDEKLCTSAQPLPDDLARLGATGLQHVINLALPTSDNAVANEAALLAAQNINYVQIPVLWENPTPEQWIWRPQGVWREFITQQLAEQGLDYSEVAADE